LLVLLNLFKTLLIKLLCVIIIDFLDLFLIISTPKNSLVPPKLVISNLETLAKSVYRLLTKFISFANTSISSTCVAKTINLVLYITILLSILKQLNPNSFRILVKNNCHYLLVCFKP
jgi:hypothetical protein